MRILISVLLLPFAVLPAHAADNPHWLEVRTAHFDVLSDAGDRQARHIAAQLEQMRALFHILLPNAASDANASIVVLALRNRKDFQTVEPADYLAKNSIDLAGLFQHTQDKNYILLRLDAEGEHPFATVYHEYTHFMLSHDDYMPLWLNEGLAEFYQNTDIHEKDVNLGQPSADDILFLRQNRLVPLTTLLTIDHNSPYYHDEQKGSVFYAEAWALTHFIIVNDFQNKTHRLQDYLVNLIHNEDSITAAQHAFGDLNRLQKQLDDYIQHSDYKMFTMKAALTIDESTLQVTPLPTPDADAVRADVLIYSRRPNEARALIETVLREDPNNALAHESMGFLETQEHDMDAARKWYGEAVQLHSRSYLSYYYFAVFSMQSRSGEPGEIESALQQCIQLNPSFAPADDALAGFYAMHHEKLDQAHMLNVTAIQLDPGNIGYRINAAQVLMAQDAIPSAINVLQAALKVAKSSNDRAILQARLDQVQQLQSYRDRQKAEDQADHDSPSTVTTVTTTYEAPNDTPKFPAGPPTGPHRTAKGVLHDVQCTYPKLLTLTLTGPGKPIALYANDLYKITYSASNFEPKDAIEPCRGIEGMKASIVYTEVSDKTVAGQIVSIMLSK